MKGGSWSFTTSTGHVAAVTLHPDGTVSFGFVGGALVTMPAADACTLCLGLQEASRISGEQRARAAPPAENQGTAEMRDITDRMRR